MIAIADINIDRTLSNGILSTFIFNILSVWQDKRLNDNIVREAIEIIIRSKQLKSATLKSKLRFVSKKASLISNQTYHYEGLNICSNVAYSVHYLCDTYQHNNISRIDIESSAIYIADLSAAAILGSNNQLDINTYIHAELVKLLPTILDYKIENAEPFRNPEKILDHLSENDKTRFLFNINRLR